MSDTINVTGRIEMVQLSNLNIDPSYQRGEKPNQKRIKKNFNEHAAGVLHVGRRADNTLWLIDGQQRCGAMIHLKIKEWNAYVIPSSGSQYEAIIFGLLNGSNRVGLSARDLFRGALEAKDPVAIACVCAGEAAGLKVSVNCPNMSHHGGDKWPYITCLGQLYRMTKQAGEETVTRALKVLAESWPKQGDALRGGVIIGWVQLYAAQGDKIDDDRMIRVMKDIPPIKLINQVSVFDSSRGRASSICKLLVEYYNKRLSHKNKLKLVTNEDDEESVAS